MLATTCAAILDVCAGAPTRTDTTPRWIEAQFGFCAECHALLLGGPALYLPRENACLCRTCGMAEMETLAPRE